MEDGGNPVSIEDNEPEDTLEDISSYMLTFDPKETSDLTPDNVLDICRFFHNVWCHDTYDIWKIHKRNLAFFGDKTQLLERFRTYSSIMVALDKRIESFEDIDGDLLKEVKEKSSLVSANILYGYDSMVQTYRQLYCNQPELQACLPPLRMDSFFVNIVDDEMKKHQKLIRYYLEECSRRGYRRQHTSLFEPKFTEEGNYTRTYTFACEISEFIYDAVYPYNQYTWLFSALTEKSGVSRLCQDYLEKCREDDLPVLKKDRTKFSFRNGLYDAKQNKFFPYNVSPEWSHNCVCANYIDVVFDHDAYESVMIGNNDPLNIPTPNIQKILDVQQFSSEVCRWLFASIGRMIFEVGNMDNWQYFPFCKGTAGSGKSTLLRLAAKFFNDIDVGNLMSEGQKNFSIEHIYDKFVFFCYDVDDKMNFSLTRWNQMVSGETISVERKFKIPVQQQWKTCGAFAGNSYPPWVDQAGNVSRRMLIFLFSKVVKVVDTHLFDKCLTELGALMKKSVECYFQLLNLHRNHGIWDNNVLPSYFHDTRIQMQAETNSLQSFVNSEQCIISNDRHVSFNDFRIAYIAYCDTLRIPKKRLTSDFCANVFDGKCITVINVPPNGDPNDYDGYTSRYLSGISLA